MRRSCVCVSSICFTLNSLLVISFLLFVFFFCIFNYNAAGRIQKKPSKKASNANTKELFRTKLGGSPRINKVNKCMYLKEERREISEGEEERRGRVKFKRREVRCEGARLEMKNREALAKKRRSEEAKKARSER